jgi:hypothetical protein
VSDLSRREFAEALALAALVPLLGTGVRAVGVPLAGVSSGIGTAATVPADPGDLAKALAGVLRAQYGDRLGEADLAAVTRQIQNGLERAEKVRKVSLANGDEPDFVFSAVRARGRG